MSKDFIPYQEALELKELGFDEPCFGKYDVYGVFDHKLFYHNHDVETEYVGCSAPLYQQAFRWFREKYQLHSYIEGAYPWFRFYINSEDNRWEGHKHLSHEEAELECLKKLIQIVKENKQ
jgi:hypothetical protein